MNDKKSIIVYEIAAVLLTLLVPDVLGGRYSGLARRMGPVKAVASRRRLNTGIRQNFNRRSVQPAVPAVKKTNRHRRNPYKPGSFGHKQAQHRRIIEQRKNALWARIKSANTRPSDDIARIGRSHSTTRQVDFGQKNDLRDSCRFTRHRKYGPGTFFRHRRRRYRHRHILPAKPRWTFSNTARIKVILSSRHNRFYRRGCTHSCRRFYYYSLPRLTCYYCVPPYYYTVPYGLYPGYERYFAGPETAAEVPDEGPVETEERPVKKLREQAEVHRHDKKLMAVNRHLSDVASAFAAGDFEKAVELSGRALHDFPDNPALLFVYSHSLFASKNYRQSAEVLIHALDKVNLQKQGIFYLLGFYHDDDVLKEQITHLSRTLEDDPDNNSLQILLAYQLMGIGDFQQASELLVAARRDAEFACTAGVLLDNLEHSKKTTESERLQLQNQNVENEDY